MIFKFVQLRVSGCKTHPLEKHQPTLCCVLGACKGIAFRASDALPKIDWTLSEWKTTYGNGY
jgi:hypothetical protein